MKNILVILSVLIVLDLAGAAGLWFGYSRIEQAKASEQELRADLAEENQKGQRLAALRQTLAAAAKDKEQLESYLIDPSDENQIKLIAAIERLGATTTGVSVTTSSFDLTQTKPPVLHGDYSLEGSWQGLYHFLRLIEEYPSRVVITRFDVRASQSPAAGSSAAIEKWVGAISIDFASLKPVL